MWPRMRIFALWLVGGIVVACAVGSGLFWWARVKVAPPPPPKKTFPTLEMPAVASHLSINASLTTKAIAALLENEIPKTFKFDERNDVHVFGSPSRGAINVTSDVAAKRV